MKVHGYVWGARGASWDRVGHLLLRVADRFSVDRGVWSTALSRSPWDDMTQAALAFGLGSLQQYSQLGAHARAVGACRRALINSRGVIDLFLFQEGRSVTRVAGVTKLGVTNLAGVVKVGSTWYIGASYGSDEFGVFRIEGSQISLFGRYPVRVGMRSGNVVTRLVQSARGDAIGIWSEARKLRGSSTSWFVFPIDLQTRRAGAPLEIAPATLVSAPPCSDEDDDGWLLEGEPPVAPYMDFVGDADPLRVHRIAARLLASARGMCIDSLAAEVDSTVPRRMRPVAGGVSTWSSGHRTVTLTVTGRGGGARWGFRCMR